VLARAISPKSWSPLLDEPFEPANSGTFVTPTVGLSHQQSEVKRFSKVEASHLPRRHFRREKVPALDGALEARVLSPATS
jgi:hypothetical protein